MKPVLGVSILVFALAGVACFGYSEDEMQLELDEQAAASDLKHTQELAELEATANAISETLHGQIDAANREVTMALVEVAVLQVEVDGLAEELRASGYQILDARTETRWSWLPLHPVKSSTPVVLAVSAPASDIHALMLHCYEGKTWLWLWPYGYELHGGENYSVFAGFGDAPLTHQATEPYNPGPAVGLLDVNGGTFWHKDTFSVQGAYGGVTIFDTHQLKRMFPTEGAFCSGAPPNSY